MDAQSLITLTKIFLVVILGLVAYNMYLVFKLKSIDPFRNWHANSINGGLMLAFLIVGLIAAAWSSASWYDMFSLVRNPASEHGKHIDSMFWITMGVTIAVVVITNTILFYFSWRYQGREGQKALFYPHNNRLELIWTLVPAIVMTVLVARGVKVWHDIMDPSEEIRETAIDVEFYARQFDWTIRYTGVDKELGQTHVKYIDLDKGNQIGFNFEDPRSHDDIVVTEVHLPVNVPVHMHIRSQDVLHSATLAHFRVKMDAVPGMPTSFWFVPTVTTAEMREKVGNPEFNYEMSCQQICGASHWNMRRVVIVESMEDYQKWLSEQKPFYAQYLEMNNMAPATQALVPPVQEEGDTELSNQTEEDLKPLSSVE